MVRGWRARVSERGRDPDVAGPVFVLPGGSAGSPERLEGHPLSAAVEDPEDLVGALVLDVHLLRPVLPDRGVDQPIALADVEELLPEVFERQPHPGARFRTG